jgi:hypothetical protein
MPRPSHFFTLRLACRRCSCLGISFDEPDLLERGIEQLRCQHHLVRANNSDRANQVIDGVRAMFLKGPQKGPGKAGICSMNNTRLPKWERLNMGLLRTHTGQ